MLMDENVVKMCDVVKQKGKMEVELLVNWVLGRTALRNACFSA